MVYRYRTGHGIKDVAAQAVGEAVAAIQAANDGRATPHDLVEVARPEDAPLHPAFEWDDEVAAERFREDQARRVIRSYVVVHRDERGIEREELANVSIAEPFSEEGPAYVPTRTAMEDPDLRERVVALAKSQLDAWHARYGHLEELAVFAEAIVAARRAQAHRQAPPRRAPRRRPAATANA
jgi:hypothetical protein